MGLPSQHQLMRFLELPTVAHIQPTPLYPNFWCLGISARSPLYLHLGWQKEARARCGWFQEGGGEQGVEWVSGGPDTSPLHTHTAGSLPPTKAPSVPREDGRWPPPQAVTTAPAWSAFSTSSWDLLPVGTRGTPCHQGAAWPQSQGQGTSCHCRSAG